MANIGLRKPIVAKRNTGGTYGTPAALGKAVSVDITPNYAEGSLYGDDMKCEEDREFIDAALTLGVTTIPATFNETLFGHSVANDGEVQCNAGDESNEVGVGLIGVEKVDGAKKYVATFMPRAKFTDPGASYQTKGDSITYNTPSITGTALATDDGLWKISKGFDTETEAETYINTRFGAS